MKTKFMAMMAIVASLFFSACSKDANEPQLTFTNNVAQGKASAIGEYTITGHLSSAVRLEKVTLTKEGQNNPFIIDESEAKNKNEYDFVYLVTDINADTNIRIDAYDQDGGKKTSTFLIMK